MLTNILFKRSLRLNGFRFFSGLTPIPVEKEVLEPEIQGSGWNATDKWTTMLREEVESDTPKVSLYHKKRNAFYKLGYNENHIPN